MTTQALFETAMGGALMELGPSIQFTASGNVLTATAHGLQTGAGPFKVMTTNADAPAGITAAVRSSLAYTPATDIEDETVTVAGKVYTWKNSPGNTDGTVDVNADNTIAAANLANAINLGPGAGTDYGRDTVANPTVQARVSGSTCVVEAKTLDSTIGDAIAVAEAAAGSWAGAGTVLANGATGTDYYIINLSANTFSLATTQANAIAGTVVALSDAGTGVHRLVRTVRTLSTALNDVVTNFLTASGTRVLPAAQNIATFWQSAIDGLADSGS